MKSRWAKGSSRMAGAATRSRLLYALAGCNSWRGGRDSSECCAAGARCHPVWHGEAGLAKNATTSRSSAGSIQEYLLEAISIPSHTSPRALTGHIALRRRDRDLFGGQRDPTEIVLNGRQHHRYHRP